MTKERIGFNSVSLSSKRNGREYYVDKKSQLMNVCKKIQTTKHTNRIFDNQI